MHRSSNEIDHFASYSAAAASWYRRFAVFASTVGDGRSLMGPAGLAAGELGLVLVDEGAHAFLLVLRREQVREGLTLDHQAGPEVAPAPRVDRDLGGAQRHRGPLGVLPGGLQGGLVHVLALRDHPVDQPD